MTEPAPGNKFDLVHARLLLVHLPERLEVLRKMAAALQPGGWLLIEDADPTLQPLVCIDEHSPAEVLANRLKGAFRTLLAERGAELAFGRTLPRLLREAGLDEVSADAYFPVTSTITAMLEVATVRQIQADLLARGFATIEEIEQHLANVNSGRMDLTISPMIAAWGRKPLPPG